jgi:hypothetical protein
MEDKDIVDCLFKEKDIARQEVFMNIKVVNQVSIILLPFFFAGLGILIESHKSKDFDGLKSLLEDWKLLMLLRIIGQVFFLLWMYAISILSNMASLAGYIKALEEKINHFSKHEISLWENRIHEKYIIKPRSAQFISTLLWNVIYFGIFVWIMIYVYIVSGNKTFLAINIAQSAIILWLFRLILTARQKSYEMSKLAHHP